MRKRVLIVEDDELLSQVVSHNLEHEGFEVRCVADGTIALSEARAFAPDVLACVHCGGRLRLIATLHDPAVIRKILAHLGMARSAPSPVPPRPSLAASRPNLILRSAAAAVVVIRWCA